MRSPHLVAALTALLAAPTAASAQSAKPAEDYTFRSPPLFGAEVAELSDLRGVPTIIEFWGTR